MGFPISGERKEMHLWSRSVESLTVRNDVLFLSPIFMRCVWDTGLLVQLRSFCAVIVIGNN